MKRNTPTPRSWPTETAYTGRLAARVPIRLRDRFKAYAEMTGQTTTDCLIQAIREYLDKRGY